MISNSASETAPAPVRQIARERPCDPAPAQIEDRLAEADALADGSDSDRATALEIYRALGAAIRPAHSRDCDRVEWVLNALRSYDMGFAPLLARAAEGAARPIVRQRAGVALGAFHAYENRFAAAEELFLRVLDEARGQGSIPERAACLNLCRLYGDQWRVFEGYVIAQHAWRLFREAADPIRAAWSATEVFRFLTEMREWEACDAIAAEVEALFEPLSDEAVFEAASNFTRYRLRAAVERGDAEQAERLLHALPATDADVPAMRDSAWFNAAMAGVVYSLLGRDDDAAAALARMHAEIPVGSPSWLVMLVHEAKCAARRGDDEVLQRNAMEFLSHGSAGTVGRLGSGRAMHLALELSKALRRRSLEPLARRALDLAGSCAIERIREIERVQRDLPELAFVTPDDRALLTRVHVRFRLERRDLLDSLVAQFERAEAAGEPWLKGLITDDHAVVCAWCTRLRGGDGEWLPVGHLVPHGGPLSLTHGICEHCLEDVQRGYA